MIEISATRFKATCLALLDQVACGAIEGVTITKRGKVVGVLRPPPAGSDLFGRMRNTTVSLTDIDPTEPVAPVFEADSGVLHA